MGYGKFIQIKFLHIFTIYNFLTHFLFALKWLSIMNFYFSLFESVFGSIFDSFLKFMCAFYIITITISSKSNLIEFFLFCFSFCRFICQLNRGEVKNEKNKMIILVLGKNKKKFTKIKNHRIILWNEMNLDSKLFNA